MIVVALANTTVGYRGNIFQIIKWEQYRVENSKHWDNKDSKYYDVYSKQGEVMGHLRKEYFISLDDYREWKINKLGL
jgi:hypothetical protein